MLRGTSSGPPRIGYFFMLREGAEIGSLMRVHTLRWRCVFYFKERQFLAPRLYLPFPMPPALAPHRRAQPMDHSITAYANALLALVIDTKWSNTSINLILNESNEIRRHELIDSWLTHRFADLDRISLTVRTSLFLTLLKLAGCSRQHVHPILTIF